MTSGCHCQKQDEARRSDVRTRIVQQMPLESYRGIRNMAGQFELRRVVAIETSYRGQLEKTPGGILKLNLKNSLKLCLHANA